MENAGTQRVTHLQTEYLQMQEIVEKRRRKRRKGLIRRLTAFALIFTAVCVFMISALVSQNNRLNSALAQKSKLEKNLGAQTQSAAQLKQRIDLLHDKNYIGEIARRDYLLSKKGEIIFSKPTTGGR